MIGMPSLYYAYYLSYLGYVYISLYSFNSFTNDSTRKLHLAAIFINEMSNWKIIEAHEQ